MRRLLSLLAFLPLCATAEPRLVLLEFSTNTSCIPCVSATEALNSDLQSVGRSNFAVVRYHTPIPSQRDPFYNNNETEADTRAQYYSIISNPSLFLDGTSAGQNTSAWQAVMQAKVGQQAPLGISLSGTRNGRSGVVNVQLSTLPSGDAKVFAVVTETGIQFQGTNGETEHDDVFRTTLTSWSGLTPATSFQLPFSIGVDTYMSPGDTIPWNLDSCRVIVWVQSPSTKAVSNAAEVWVRDLIESGVTETAQPAAPSLAVYPQPAHGALMLDASSFGTVQQTRIVDLLGRTVRAFTGSAPRAIDVAQLPAGVYRLIVAGARGTRSESFTKF